VLDFADRFSGELVRRRHFIALFAGALAARSPVAAQAQQPAKLPRVGILYPGDVPSGGGFFDGLHALGYTEGENIVLERRFADWNPQRYSQLAQELVALKVDVIVVISSTPASAAKQATDTIPIVVGAMADPAGDGLISNLAHPGGNITGTTFLGPELIPKRFGLLKSTIPGLSRVAALWHPGAYSKGTVASLLQQTEQAAATLGLQLQLAPAEVPADIEGAFAAMAREHAEALVVSPSPMLYGEYKQIVALASAQHLPAIYAAREFVDVGGFMAYGTDLVDVFRRTASYVERILKGAKPADLPVEQPTKFEFVVNMKTAKALGVSVPPGVLAIADEVID